MLHGLREDWKAARRGEYRISKGSGRVYARIGEGPMDSKTLARARLSTELKVMRADGKVEKYRVRADGTLETIKDSLWQMFTRMLAKISLPIYLMARSLRQRITI